MRAATLFLLTLGSLFGEALGETIFHLRNDGLYNSDNIVLRRDFSKNRVTMCYNGLEIFIAEGSHVSKGSTIFWIPDDLEDPDFDPYVYEEIPSTYNIAIDCCCNYVVYGYPVKKTDNSEGFYKIQLRSLERDGISIDFKIEDEYLVLGAINVLCDEELVRVTTKYTIFMFDILNPADPPVINDLMELLSHPRCSDTWSDGTTEYLLTSYEDWDAIEVTSLDGSIISQERTFVMDGILLKTACITVDGDYVYSFSRKTDLELGTLIRVPASQVISTTDPNGYVDVTDYVPITFDLEGVDDFVNGLYVCVDCASKECIAASSPTCLACSEADYDHCGFCSADRQYCMCGAPRDAGCNYDSEIDELSCLRPVDKLDAYCVVYNPEAHRRKGHPIEVAVAVAPTDQANYDSSNIRRASQTGRYSKVLPLYVPLVRNPFLVEGFSAEVPTKARGRRFGFYSADINRVDGIVENIFCLSTEKSAFRNKVFTYVSYEGGSVNMEVIMENDQYENQVSWRVTNLETGKSRHLSNRGKLSYTISPVIKRSHEGLFEVYRVHRYLRTWHPLLYLYVRACPKDRFGWDCSRICPFCGNGICDVSTGECRCYPGFTGESCSTPCESPDMIGQNCEIRCSGIFPLIGNDCINLEICGAEDLACGCRSGLKPPDCLNDCAEGTWGPLCDNLCSCGLGERCHPRLGCI